jgi:hypothetical protein
MSVNGFDSVHQEVFVILVLIGSILSSLASTLMLIIMVKIKVWNGHLLLVQTMTILQLIYDLSFFPGMIDVGIESVTIISNVLQLFSGITSSLVSNVVAWITFYIIFYKKSVDIFHHYPLLMILISIVGLIDCIVFLMSLQSSHSELYKKIAVLYIYYYLKLFSIILNVLFVSLTYYEIRRITSGKTNRLSSTEKSIHTLSMRLFYYPVVQIISRIGIAWYEFSYGYDSSSNGNGMNFNPPQTSNTQFAAQCMLAITMPVASIGYLWIFLLMQPRAYGTLLQMVGCSSSRKDGEDEDNSDSNNNNINGDEERKENDGAGGEGDDSRSLMSFASESQLRFSLIESEA